MRRISHALLLLCVHGVVACAVVPPTEVMVSIDADPGVRAGAVKLDVRVLGGPRGTVPTVQATQSIGAAAEPVGWPVHVALTPAGGDVDRVYIVEGVARDATDAVVGVVRAQSGFVPHRVLGMRLLLEDCCRAFSPTCAPEQTCRSCGCVSDAIDPTTLPPYDGGPGDAGPGDAGLGSDSGASDSGSDGGVDAGGAPETLPFPTMGVDTYTGSFCQGAGAQIAGMRATSLPSVSRLGLTMFVTNGLTCGGGNVAVSLNGTAVGNLTFFVGQNYVMQTFTFAPISGPTYTVQLAGVGTNTCSTCGGFSFDGTSTVTFFAT